MKEICKVKDFCTVITGQSPQSSSYNGKGEGIEFHQGKKAFGDFFIEHSNVWTTEITKIAEPNDILMSVRAPVGSLNITDRRICIGRGLAAIRCNAGIEPLYVWYALRNIESKIVGNNGAVFNSINKKQIEDIYLPYYPLAEQRTIVATLDALKSKVDQLQANCDKITNECAALKQAILRQVFE